MVQNSIILAAPIRSMRAMAVFHADNVPSARCKEARDRSLIVLMPDQNFQPLCRGVSQFAIILARAFLECDYRNEGSVKPCTECEQRSKLYSKDVERIASQYCGSTKTVGVNSSI